MRPGGRITCLLGVVTGAACFAVDELRPSSVGLGGGQEVTIIGSGFSGDSFLGANEVFVDGRSCEVMEEFTTENKVVCKRLPAADAEAASADPKGVTHSPSGASRRVDVRVDGRWITRTQAMSYQAELSPLLEGVGHVSVVNGRLPFRGQLISRFPKHYRVEVGGLRCNALAYLEEGNIEAFSEEPGRERHFFCAPDESDAGWYNLTVSLEADLVDGSVDTGEGETATADQAGSALPAQRSLPDLFAMNRHGDVYQVAHHPTVTGLVPARSSTLGGTLVVVSGSGFSSNVTDNAVAVGSQECVVVSASQTRLTCELPPATESGTGACTCACPCACCKVGTAGLLHEQWKLFASTNGNGDGAGGDGDGMGDPSVVATPAHVAAVRAFVANRVCVWEDDLRDWDVLKYGTHFQASGIVLSGQETRVAQSAQAHDVVNVLSGFFMPPHTGEYRFYVSGNDFAELRLQTGEVLQLVAGGAANANVREGRYYGGGSSGAPSVSAPLALTEGEPVYLEVHHADHTGDNFFHIGVSHSTDSLTDYNKTGDPYHTVPTMATVVLPEGASGSIKVQGKSVSIPSRSGCDFALGGAIEAQLGQKAHVVSSGQSAGEAGGCVYFVHVFRPQGGVAIVKGSAQSEAVVDVLVAGSLDFYYEPIPMNFLRMPVKTHGEPVTVTVNGLSALHNNTAGLSVAYSASLVSAASSVSATARLGAWLAVQVSSPASLVVDVATTFVKINGVPCASVGEGEAEDGGLRVSAGLVECRVPDLTAGVHTVDVHLGEYGRPAGGPFTTTYPLEISSITPGVSGGVHGGAVVTLNGQGFGSVKAEVSVTVGGAPCVVSRVTSTSVVCVTPAGQAGTVGVVATAYGMTSNSASYTYSNAVTPTVANVAMSTGVPRLPSSGGGTLVVVGTAFPLQAVVRVLLCDGASRCSNCEVDVATATETRVECKTPPLQGGTYAVRVQDPAVGWSQAGVVMNADFVVSSFSPTSGSNVGGGLLTFDGFGFTVETFVMIGPITEVGLRCAIRNVTDTSLTCQIERNFRQMIGYLTVRVYANEVASHSDGIHAACPPRNADTPATFDHGCVYLMSVTQRAAVTSFSQVSPALGGHKVEVRIRGSGLEGVTEVRAGETDCDVDSVTETLVSCTMGAGVSGSFRLDVTDENGFASLPKGNSQWYRFATRIDKVEPSSGSEGGGTLVTIGGAGFHNAASTTVEFGGAECRVHSVTNTQVVCMTSPGEGSPVVNVTSGGVTGERNNVYAHDPDRTPFITSVALQEGWSGAMGGTLELRGRNLLSGGGAPNVTLGGVACSVHEGAAADKLSCSIPFVPALAEAAPVVDTVQGLSQHNRQVKVSVPLSFDVSNTPTSGGFGGRTVQLTGSGLGFLPGLSVKVCGLPCKVTSVASAEGTTVAECLSPKLPTAAVVAEAPDLWPAEDLKMAAWSTSTSTSSNLEAAKLVDGQYTTFGRMPWKGGFFLDAGEGFVVRASEIWFFPADLQKDAPRSYLQGMQIGIGNSRSAEGTFGLLHNVSYIPGTGWTKLTMNDSIPHGRYIRFFSPDRRIAMSEVLVRGHLLVDSSVYVNGTCPVTASVVAPSTWPEPVHTAVTADSSINGVAYAPIEPVITAFDPPYGTAAGGTVVTMTGERLDGTGPPEVVMDGVPCEVVEATSTRIACKTGPRPLVPTDTLTVGVVVRVPVRGYASVTADPFLYADKWSSTLTWGGAPPPQEGDSAVLVKGRNIILDESPPRLFFLVVDGALIFDDSQDLNLELQYMLVRGGHLQIGSRNKPFQHRATITLHGNRSSIPLPVYGTKNIAVRGGNVLMYGKPKLPTWTRLAATAAQGATSVTLREAVNWEVGDEIAIAPGSYDYMEYESREITAIDVTRRVLTFSTPLKFEHFGTTENHHGIEIDMSIEVGVLTRNIRIQGDVDSWKQKFGAHMIFHSPNRPVKAHLEYIEMRRVGQAKIVGRYPIHFHMEGNRPRDVWVKGCSVHHSFNRAIVLHKTSFVTVERNIAFDAMGHMFFVEDGNEKYNNFYYNLGIGAKPTGGQLAHDIFTSVFWVANPQNDFVGNAAAGSSHMGFWVSPPKHPRRGSFTEFECPSQLPLGLVRDNTAHSNGRHGFWVHPDHYARETECGPSDEASNPYVVSTVSNLRTWKNREQGMGLVDTGPYIVENLVSIDCDDAGLEVGDITGAQGALVRNSVFVAHSKTNRAGEWKRFRGVTGYRGLITPKSEGFRGEGLTFIGFKGGLQSAEGETAEHAGVYTCCRCWNDCSSEMGGFTTRFSRTTWHDCEHRVMFGFPHNDMLVDEDGTFGGGEAGATLLPHLRHVAMPECAVGALPHEGPTGFGMWTGSRGVAGMICPAKYSFHRVVIHLPEPVNQLLFTYDIQSPNGHETMVYDESKNRLWTNGWATPVATSTDAAQVVPFNIYYGENLDWRKLQIWVTELEWNPLKSRLQLDFNYTDEYALFDMVSRNQAGSRNRNLLDAEQPPQVYPMAFRNASDASGAAVNGSFCNMDQAAKIASLVFQSEGDEGRLSLPAKSRFCEMSPIPCIADSNGQCIKMLEEVGPEEWNWTDAQAWDGNPPPGDEDIAFIPKGRTIYLSGSAKLKTLIIQGRLIFVDGLGDVSLEASHVLIHSGELIIGTPESPFMDNAAVNLIGAHDIPSLAISREHSLGSGVLANFGVLQVHGANFGRTWSKLAETAEAGMNQVTLVDDVQWEVGGKVWVSSTDYDSDHFDVRDITAITGRTLTLSAPLTWRHLGTTSDGFELRGEVGYLTRNVVLSNPNAVGEGKFTSYKNGAGAIGNYGCHVMFGELSNDPQFSGQGSLSYTEFSHCGQYGGDRGAFYMHKTTRANVSLTGVSMWHSNSHAIKVWPPASASPRIHIQFTQQFNVDGTSHLVVEDSVIYRSRETTVQLRNKEDNRATFIGNLIGGTELAGPGLAPEDGCALMSRYAIKARFNVIAGAWGEGLCIRADACGTPAAEGNIGNEVHSAAHGVYVVQGPWCSELAGLHAWKNSYLGVFSMIQSNLVVRDSVFHDNRGAINMIKLTFGRRTCTVRDTVIAGRSSVEYGRWCGEFNCVSYHGDDFYGRASHCRDRGHMSETFLTASTGITLTQSRVNDKTKGKRIPFFSRKEFLPLPYDRLGDVSFFGVTYVTNVTFKNFKMDAGCGRDAVFITMGLARSHTVPHVVTEAKWENVDELAKFYYHRSSDAWRTGVQCGEGWDCTGLEMTLVQSPDNTLFSESWNAVKCPSTPFGELFMRSLDPDGLDRTVYPLRVEHTDKPGKPFYLVNQPPDKYMESEWPTFTREPYFWAVLETTRHYRIDFGDLAPRRSQWELKHCARNEKVLLSVHYQEPLKIQVWLDPDNNETGRALTSESMVYANMTHSMNYYEGGAARLVHVVLECNKGFEIHQLLEVKVQMRLEMTIDEFFDEGSSTTFARNLASLLGVPLERVRIVNVVAGSLIMQFVIVAEDAQAYDAVQQAEALRLLAEKVGNITDTALENALGVKAVIEGISVSSANPGSCANGTVSDPTLCVNLKDDDGMPGWAVALVVVCVVLVAAVAAAVAAKMMTGSGTAKLLPVETSDDGDVKGESDLFGDADVPEYTPKQFNPDLTGAHAPQEPHRPNMDANMPQVRPRANSMQINLEGPEGDADCVQPSHNL